MIDVVAKGRIPDAEVILPVPGDGEILICDDLFRNPPRARPSNPRIN
jgi:hypothetical protein